MNNKKLAGYQLLVGLLALILFCTVFWFVSSGIRAKRELATLNTRQIQMQAQLKEDSQDYQARHAYLKKMVSDPAFFERIVRERLEYSREGEVVFRFTHR